MNVGPIIGKIRRLKDLSRAEVGRRIERSASAISRIESGQRVPSLGVLESICKALAVPVYAVTYLAGTDKDPAITRIVESALNPWTSEEEEL